MNVKTAWAPASKALNVAMLNASEFGMRPALFKFSRGLHLFFQSS